jgi:hypothetical protein
MRGEHIGSFTISDKDQPLYPAYIVVTDIGDKVRIHIRGEYNFTKIEKDSDELFVIPGTESKMTMDKKEFEKLLQDMLRKLHDD